jgi:tRNA (guanine10-N2)-dimethyltransferase
MALLFVLKQNEPELASAEAKAAVYGWGWWEHKEQAANGLLLIDGKARSFSHLALTKRIIKVKHSCAPGNLRASLASLSWKDLSGKSYKVVLTHLSASKESERELANIIWRSQQNPVVDVKNPDMTIDIVIAPNSAYIGTRIWENTEEFESRRAHKRPEMHPTSLHPALARALVSIGCATTMHDAFCGSGGILIEAGLAHKKVSGGDIDTDMIARARRNCAAYGVHPELRVADATQWIPRVQAIVSDLPYGRNTTPIALQPLLEAFLHRAAQSTSRAVLGLPSAMPFPKEWKVRAHFTSYVHKSMTKHFYVVERNQK